MRFSVHHAFNALVPDATWRIVDTDDYHGVEWLDSNIQQPSREVVQAWLDEKNAAEPMRLLRIERNNRLAKADWVALRASFTGTPIPPEWVAYTQALRDLPETSQPQVDAQGRLDMSSVAWPIEPSA